VSDHHDQLAQLDMQTLKPREFTIQVFDLYLLLFRSQQSVDLLYHVSDALRSFVARFPRFFFVATSEYCAQLTTKVLQRSAAQNNGIRVQASTLLYLMLRHCHQVTGNIGRMISVTINCLSKLIDDGTLTDDTLLRVSLARIPLYATFEYSVPGRDPHLKYNRRGARAHEVSSHLKAKFAREVHALTGTLGKILADTVQTNLLEKMADAEMRADLFLRIADGYAETPDLRIAWLEKLARLHQSSGLMTEAALCYVHIAYLIAVYLTQQGMALNLAPFRTLCPGTVVSVNEDLCQNTERFSKSGLVTAVRVSISFLRNAELYEYAGLLYEVLLPVFKSTREFNNLSQAHRQLDSIWQDMWQKGKDRIFGKYYRVGFYSDKFGELDGKEFVYKLPKLTHLYELSGRLKEFYGRALLGTELVVMPDSGAVDRTALDHSKAYLQITSVDAHFDEGELSERDTDFLRNTNLSRFVYDTPFTKSGVAQTENVDEQWKRRTVLTTEVSFPHMVSRVPVRAREDTVLSPIDVGIEEVSKRIISLRGEIEKSPPELKSLQRLLQGSVLIMVNAGVLEFARRFFGKPEPWSYAKLMLLGEKLRQFLKACSDALDLNREHSDGSPQAQNYDKELRSGYAQLYEEMTAYLERPLHEDDGDRTEGTEFGTNTETDGMHEDLADNLLLLDEHESADESDESEPASAADGKKKKRTGRGAAGGGSSHSSSKHTTLKVTAVTAAAAAAAAAADGDSARKSARRSSRTPRRASTNTADAPKTSRR
jgi:DHR-2, Lobe A/DHR-2, Lobe B/DHR-2, Lobe C